MDHEFFQEMMSAYLDNELKPEQKAMFEQYLEEHPELQAELDEMRQLDRLVESHSGLDGDDYWERSAEKIEARLGIADTEVTDIRKETDKRKSGVWWKAVSVVAACLVLAFIGLHQSDIFFEAQPDISEPRPSHQTVDTTAPELPPAVQEAETPDVLSDEAARRSIARPNATLDGAAGGSDESVSQPSTTKTKVVPDETSEDIDSPPLPPPGPKEPLTPPGFSVGVSGPKTFSDLENGESTGSSTQRIAPEAEEAVAPESDALNYKSDLDNARDLLSPGSSVVSRFSAESSPAQEKMNTGSARLDSLRARRDSLTALYNSLGKEDQPGGGTAASGFESSPRKVQEAPVVDGHDSRLGRRRQVRDVCSDLMDTWYEIIRVSPDSTEIDRGRVFLQGVALDTTTINQDKAKRLLRQLEGH